MRTLLTRASLIAIVLLNAGCGGSPSSMPVITITPWVPPAALNPLVLSVTVKVTNKGSYVFLDSSGATTSKLIVSAKDKLGNPFGLPIEQDIKVATWADGSSNSVPLNALQKALYDNDKTKTVMFEVAVVCQKGTDLPGKVGDTETFTKP